MRACFYTITLQPHFEVTNVTFALERNHLADISTLFLFFGLLRFGSVPSVGVLMENTHRTG